MLYSRLHTAYRKEWRYLSTHSLTNLIYFLKFAYIFAYITNLRRWVLNTYTMQELWLNVLKGEEN